MRLEMKMAIVFSLILCAVAFSQDVVTPSLKPEDENTILKIQKSLVDLHVQYDAQYQRFLQSNEVVSITAQSVTLGDELNKAWEKAMADAKIDTTKWAVDKGTFKITPIQQPQGKP